MGMPDYIDLELTSPWLNAAGMLGFAPGTEDWPLDELQGGFVTNPISAVQRTPAESRAVLTYPGGALLHSGLPNPGLRAVLRKYGERWARSRLPIWVHLLADGPDDVHRMALVLEETEGVTALEIGIPPGAPAELALGMLAAAVGELAVIASLPLTAAGEPWLKELPGLGIRGVCLSAPRGALFSRSGSSAKVGDHPIQGPDVPPVHGPEARPVKGRLVGPGLFPQALAALQTLLPLGLPVIAGSGVSSIEAGRELLSAGAAAVQLDTVLWM